MARRKKPASATSKTLDSIALIPWWAGVLLAAGAFALFYNLGPSQPLSPIGIAQYAVPAVILVLAAVSAWRGVSRRNRASDGDDRSSESHSGHADKKRGEPSQALDRLSFDEFLPLLGEAFRLQGYQVVDNVGSGTSGRVDMVLRRERETFLVLCKQWKDSRIGVETVQKLQRAMSSRSATGGFVVTIGRFSRDATSFAAGCNVRLIDGPALHGMVERARSTRSRTL